MNVRHYPLLQCASALVLSLIAATASAKAGEDLAASQARIVAMTEDQREQLARSVERFNQLAPEEQGRLRELNSAVSQSPNEAELRQVMTLYHEWFKSLPPAEKARLSEMTSQEKFEKVKALRNEQLLTSKKEVLTDEDRDRLVRWVVSTAMENQEEIVANIPAGHRNQWYGGSNSRFMRGRLVVEMFEQMEQGKSIINATDIEELRGELSPKASQALAAAAPLPAQIKLIRSWHTDLMRGRMQPMASRPERLKKFYDQLSAEEQRSILQISDQWKREAEIWKRYWKHQLAEFVSELSTEEQKRLSVIENQVHRDAETRRLYFEGQLDQFVEQLPQREQERLLAIKDENERLAEKRRMYWDRERREGQAGFLGFSGFARDGNVDGWGEGPRRGRGFGRNSGDNRPPERGMPEGRGWSKGPLGPRPPDGRGPERGQFGPTWNRSFRDDSRPDFGRAKGAAESDSRAGSGPRFGPPNAPRSPDDDRDVDHKPTSKPAEQPAGEATVD